MAQPQLIVNNEGKNVEIATIATSAVLLDLHVSSWTSRKRDKKTSAEVNHDKQTTSDKAASVVKNLMSDDADLDAIRAYGQDTRLWVQKHTLAWSDGGTRLLPSQLIFEVTSEIEARITAYDALVAKFVSGYSVKVSAAAFKLGKLFDRSEFPDADAVARKFNMRYTVSPVPTVGDFRVDVQNDIGDRLKEHFQKAATDYITTAMREPWERVYNSMVHMKERLEASIAHEAEEGEDARRRPKLFQSLIDNNLELATMLDKLNIAKDPQLSDCAARIRRMVSSLDIKSVRESKDTQMSIKKQVDDILDTFNFGGFDE